jgi:hypothetical protein
LSAALGYRAAADISSRVGMDANVLNEKSASEEALSLPNKPGLMHLSASRILKVVG